MLNLINYIFSNSGLLGLFRFDPGHAFHGSAAKGLRPWPSLVQRPPGEKKKPEAAMVHENGIIQGHLTKTTQTASN
ncbi:MAG: hypothetical protein N2Z70_03395 [Bdellovibrionaceae bacterium]|nr:hypothetical protein [Pseudobdellovibrionaceae bacterium]